MKDVTKMTVPKLRDWARTATEEELRIANKVIVDSMNNLRRLRDLDASMKYRIGQRVKFVHKGKEISGTVERVNQRTLSLHDCSDGMVWKVGYEFMIN